MSSDPEIAKAQYLAWAAGFVLITGFFSFDEIRYALFGKTTRATVTQTRTAPIARYLGGLEEKLVIEYSFQDGSGIRSEKDYLPLDRPRPPAGTITVRYLEGEPDASRIAGNRNDWAISGFVGSLIAACWFVARLVREASAPSSRSRPTTSPMSR